MAYLVLARKWRPKSFSEVVGQATVTRTLTNALAGGRIGHAFLFSGARGVGKTTTARILAKALNCSAGENPTPEPCGSCPACTEIAAGTSLDVQEIDGATHNGVEQVRELRESARYNPARDRFKIWIIDEVHMLSTGAFNALLKTLEEPPPRVKFIFATTEYHKIPDTILSRCQQYDFRLIPARELAAHLRTVADGEGVRITDETLGRIARAAEGSARDALSLLDQILSFSGETVSDEDVQALLGLIDRELLMTAAQATLTQDNLAMLDLVERLADYGTDYRAFTRELLLYFREILLVKLAPPDSSLLAQVLPEERERLQPLAQALSEEDLLRFFEILTKAEAELRWAQDPRVTLELALLKVIQLRRLMPFTELVARVERLAGPGGPPPAARDLPPPPPARRPAPPPDAVRPDAAQALAPPRPPAPERPVSGPEADSILAGMLAQAQSRPSLVPALRNAAARLEGGTLILEVSPEFAPLAEVHRDEYGELAQRAAGRPLKLQLVSGAGSPQPEPQAEDLRRQQRRAEAAQEPAVQEAMQLFQAKILDVQED